MANSGQWDELWDEVRPDVMVYSTTSLICSSLLCVLYWWFPRVRRTPGWLVMRATLCEMMVSIAFLLICYLYGRGSVLSPDTPSGVDHSRIWILVLCLSACEVASSSWRTLVYFHLVCIYHNPFNPERFRWLYLPGVVFAAVATIALCCLKLSSVPSVSAYFDVLVVGFCIVPFVILTVVGSTLHVAVCVLVSRAVRDARLNVDGRHASISVLARQRVMLHGTAYLAEHGVVLALGIVTVVLLMRSPWSQHALHHLLTLLLCARPTFSFACWLGIHLLRRRQPDTDGIPSPASAAASRPRWQRGPLLRAPTPALGGREVGRMNSLASTASRSRAAALLRGPRGAMELRSVATLGIEEAGFKEELRFELLFDVACGIGHLAQRELHTHFRSGGMPGTKSEGRDRMRSGSFKGDSRPSARNSLSTASGRLSGGSDEHARLGRISSSPPIIPFEHSGHARSAVATSSTFSAAVWARPSGENALSACSEGHSPTSSSECSEFGSACPVKHYEVDQFRKIREAFSVSTAAYARAFPNDLSEADPRWREKLRESVSEGASGSFFYRVLAPSADNVSSRFIVKQIRHKEKNTLLAMLPAYTRHVTERGGRSLIQYLGCHSMSLGWRYSGRIYFVVMRNIFPVKPWLCFDLKGATANRRALSARFLDQIHAGSDPSACAVYGTLRDWEWMDVAMTVDVGPHDKASLAEIIAADAAFLSAQGLLDYSLLVGVHRITEVASPHEREARVAQLVAAGGYVSVDRHKVYFFGIIDVLERYNTRWQAQHMALSLGYHLVCKGNAADGISAMSPHDYSERFQTFVTLEVLGLTVSDSPALGIARSASEATERQATEDERWVRRRCRCGRRAPSTLERSQRWRPLWQRRRRGLVRERFEAERFDHMQRIRELEKQTSQVTRHSARCAAAEVETRGGVVVGGGAGANAGAGAGHAGVGEDARGGSAV